jgi:hypothetical protein
MTKTNRIKTHTTNNTHKIHIENSTTDLWRCGDWLPRCVKICSLPSHALPWSGSNGSVSTLARLPEYPWQEISNRTYYVASLRTHYRDQVRTVVSQPWPKSARVPAAKLWKHAAFPAHALPWSGSNGAISTLVKNPSTRGSMEGRGRNSAHTQNSIFLVPSLITFPQIFYLQIFVQNTLPSFS